MVPLEECMLIFPILGEEHCCKSLALIGCVQLWMQKLNPTSNCTYCIVSVSYFLEVATWKETYKNAYACVCMFVCLFWLISS